MSLSLIIDTLLAALLLATIGFCAVLEQRLRVLRREQNVLNGTIRAVNGAVAAARANVAALRGSAAQTIEALNTQSSSARGLADELTMLISMGESVAQRIQENATVPILDPLEAEQHAEPERAEAVRAR